jgi:hypothetical protein
MTTTGVEHSMTPRAQSILGKCILVLGFFPILVAVSWAQTQPEQLKDSGTSTDFWFEIVESAWAVVALRRWRLATAERSR